MLPSERPPLNDVLHPLLLLPAAAAAALWSPALLAFTVLLLLTLLLSSLHTLVSTAAFSLSHASAVAAVAAVHAVVGTGATPVEESQESHAQCGTTHSVSVSLASTRKHRSTFAKAERRTLSWGVLNTERRSCASVSSDLKPSCAVHRIRDSFVLLDYAMCTSVLQLRTATLTPARLSAHIAQELIKQSCKSNYDSETTTNLT
jgi:hypothetical protein